MIKIIITICFIGLTGCFRGDSHNKAEMKAMEKYRGRSVLFFLDDLGLSLNEVEYVDEPPGKLKILRFKKIYHAPTDAKKFEVYLKYDASLFSSARSWEKEAINKAIIDNVKTEPER